MPKTETTHVVVDGVDHQVVLHMYGAQDWRAFVIKPGSQVRMPHRGKTKEEVLEKIKAALES